VSSVSLESVIVEKPPAVRGGRMGHGFRESLESEEIWIQFDPKNVGFRCLPNITKKLTCINLFVE